MLTYLFLGAILPEIGRRVASIFVFAVFFWALEIIPLYATSLSIVLLLSFALTAPVDLLALGDATYFFRPFASPVIILFLGGLTLAAAAQKHGVDRFLLEKMLVRLGTHPSRLIVGFLCSSAFFSMWISNTAAAALMLALTAPVIEGLASTDPMRKGLALSIAFGANIGGIGTPIGTPPNAIAIGLLRDQGVEVNFLSWMVMAVPLAIILLMVAALVLRLFFHSQVEEIPLKIERSGPLAGRGIGVLVVAAITILLWLTQPLHHLPESLISLLAVGLLAAFGLISRDDFRRLPWDVLVLMWGGLALGEAMLRSALLQPLLGFATLHPFVLILLFCLAAILLTAFISNTATANLLLPILLALLSGTSSLLMVAVALCCSFSMAFPISSPPNAMAYGTGLFGLGDMFKSGAVIALAALIIVLLGFWYVIPWAHSL
jgi:solute carrier family 13 (sodium-dependent dicarboxylate transporter), member 2/3/5